MELRHCVLGGALGVKIDLSICYWSVRLMARAVSVAAGGTTYALVRVPLCWHQAPGLVRNQIGAVLAQLLGTKVVIVQYLEDNLFVVRGRS